MNAPARVLVIGGYGNFGSYVARALATDASIRLLIGGRSQTKADAFVATLAPAVPAEAHALDIDGDIAARLAAIRPDLVIHTTGPFQHQSYVVAEAAIACGAHYLDLADARAFVAGIGALDTDAQAAGVAVIAGASSVPCLSSAIVDHYLPDFTQIKAIRYGITAAQQTNRGLATTTAILSYVGKPFAAWRKGKPWPVHGWQGTHAVRYPDLGRRLFGDCDIPDLELFPQRYPGVEQVRFSAGHEIALLHLGTWGLSWLVRLGLIRHLDRHAEALLKLAFCFDRLGHARSGMHMRLDGTGHDGAPLTRRFFLVARSGHGPYIPCMPAILLAKRLAAGEAIAPGARPCLDLIDLDTYLGALEGLDIEVWR
ncbi:saccharopine dehydrogenase family protein [Sphingomonas sp.]|uniref:saccharopine dehydrogenase family protein n=1 Tax=Sphingomonas sp. TaxID=28214 RepID=UPI003CC68374